MTPRKSDQEPAEPASLQSLQKQLAQLAHRVEWLEKALEEKRSTAPTGLTFADFKRRMAQLDARWKAIEEFVSRDEPPERKARREAYREELNDHLRSLGFEALKSP